MIKKLLCYFQGYITIYFKAQYANRFFNICHYKKIPLWNIQMEPQENMVRFSIRASDYKKLQPVLRKLHHAGKISEKKGFCFWWFHKKKQPYFFVGLLCYFFLIFFLSGFLWELQIRGGEKYTSEYLISVLKKEKLVCAGSQKDSVDLDGLKRWVRNRFPDIGWVNATIKGSILHVELVEIETKQLADNDTAPVHIVAPKDGVIASVITRTGNPIVKKGDAVSKGAILVSGIIPIKGDDDTVISQYAVHADADIFLDSEYHYYDCFSIDYQKKVLTNEEKNVWGIGFSEHYIYFSNPFFSKIKASCVDCVEEDRSVPITKDFFFPLQLKHQVFHGYEWIPAQYTQKEAFSIAENKLNQIIQKFQKKGVLILDNNVKISLCGKKCVSEGTLRLIEPVTTTQKVKPDEWRINE